MMLYNVRLLTKDPECDGGFICDVIDAMDSIPDIDEVIKSLSTYRFEFDPALPMTDRKVQIVSFDDRIGTPSYKVEAEKWFHEV